MVKKIFVCISFVFLMLSLGACDQLEKSEFELWVESKASKDINGDKKIDEEDYELYLLGDFDPGTYRIINYTYEGNPFYIGDNLLLKKFGTYLEQIVFTVDQEGVVTAEISEEAITAMGEEYDYVIEGLNHITLTRISKLLIALDTYVTIDLVKFNVTLYLNENENGYSTEYTINYDEKTATMTFDLIKD